MYDFKIEAADKPTSCTATWQARSQGLVAGEPDAIANMANAAALIWESLPDINWVGFYRNVGGELVLGPFQGRPACIRIAFGEGVCGAAAADPRGPAGRGRPRLSRPHRLRQRVEQRDRRAADPRRRIARRARHRQPAARRASTEEDRGRLRSGSREITGAPCDLAELLQPLVAERAGDEHHRARQIARIIAAETAHQRARDCRSARRPAPAPRHRRGRRYSRAGSSPRSPCWTTMLASIPTSSRISPTAALTTPSMRSALLFLDRRLDSAELDEVLRLDEAEHLDPAAGLGRAAGGEAQARRALPRCRRPRPDRCVSLARPPWWPSAAAKRGAAQAAARHCVGHLTPTAALALSREACQRDSLPCRSNSRCPRCPRRWRRARSPNGWSRRATRSNRAISWPRSRPTRRRWSSKRSTRARSPRSWSPKAPTG